MSQSVSKIVNTSNISGKFPGSFLESFRQNKFMEVLQPYRIVGRVDGHVVYDPSDWLMGFQRNLYRIRINWDGIWIPMGMMGF